MLTKKEKQIVDSNKATIEKPAGKVGEPERYRVYMSLTKGELLALENGMTAYGEAGSHVGKDVGAYIRNAVTREGITF